MSDVKNSSLATGLTSYWKLEETSGTRYDSHGSNNLTDNNTVLYSSAVQGNGAEFVAASAEYLSIPSTTQFQLDLGAENFSVSLWFNADTVSGVQGLIGKYNNSSTNKPWLIYLNGTSLVFLVGSQGAAVTSSTTISANTWYHVVATADTSNNYKLYVNAGTPNTGSGASSTGTTGIDFCIGAYNSGSSGRFDGTIDEVGIWDGALLSSTDVSTLYNSGAGIPYDAGGAATVLPQFINFARL